MLSRRVLCFENYWVRTPVYSPGDVPLSLPTAWSTVLSVRSQSTTRSWLIVYIRRLVPKTSDGFGVGQRLQPTMCEPSHHGLAMVFGWLDGNLYLIGCFLGAAYHNQLSMNGVRQLCFPLSRSLGMTSFRWSWAELLKIYVPGMVSSG